MINQQMLSIFSLSIVILALVIVVNTVIAVLTLSKNPKAPINRAFFFFILLVILWLIDRFFEDIATPSDTYNELLTQLALLPPLFVPYFFMRFVYIFYGRWGKVKKWLKILIFSLAVIMAPFIFTKYNGQVTYEGNIELFYPGTLYIWFSVYFSIVIAYSLYVLKRSKKTYDKVKQKQADYIFWGSFSTAFLGLFFSAVLPMLGLPQYYYFGSLSSVIFTGFVSYAILRYRFVDWRVLNIKTVVRLLAALPSFVLVYLVMLAVTLQTSPLLRTTLIFSATILAIVIFGLSQRLLLNFFGQIGPDTEGSIDKLCKLVAGSPNLASFADSLKEEILLNLKVADVHLLTVSTDGSFYAEKGPSEYWLSKDKSALLRQVLQTKGMVNLEEAKYLQLEEAIIDELSRMKIDLVVPMFYEEHLIGLVLIVNKGELFTEAQYKYLYGLQNEIKYCLNNVLLYEQTISRIRK